MVGRRHHIDDAGRNVALLRDDLAEHRRAPGRVGRSQHHRVPRGQRRAQLGQVDLVREVPRGDGADDAHGLPADPPVAGHPHRLGPAEVPFPLVRLDEIGEPAQIIDGRVQLGPERQEPGRAHLLDREFAQLVGAPLQPLAELPQAPHAERVVGRPGRLVERAPGGADRAVHVVGGGVGGGAEHLLGRGIDRLEGAARPGDEPPVQQKQAFGSSGHLSRLQFSPYRCARGTGIGDRFAGSVTGLSRRPPS